MHFLHRFLVADPTILSPIITLKRDIHKVDFLWSILLQELQKVYLLNTYRALAIIQYLG